MFCYFYKKQHYINLSLFDSLYTTLEAVELVIIKSTIKTNPTVITPLLFMLTVIIIFIKIFNFLN